MTVTLARNNTEVRVAFREPLSPARLHHVLISGAVTDLDNFATVNEVMAEYCSEPYPARAAVQVAALPKGVDIEADAILAL